jgi:hypothetical protein
MENPANPANFLPQIFNPQSIPPTHNRFGIARHTQPATASNVR